MGLLGVLAEARRLGLISSLRETMEELQRVAGFGVSDELKARLFAEAGE